MRFLVVGAVAVVMSGCMTPSGVTPVIHVQPGRQFNLAIGQEAQIQGTGVSIRFSGVGEDSRCGIDVQCIWAGNAVVRLTLSSSATTPDESALNTGIEPRQTPYAGYTIRLVGLNPAPRSGRQIAQTEYVAILEVVN
jgi:hypothetical protein